MSSTTRIVSACLISVLAACAGPTPPEPSPEAAAETSDSAPLEQPIVLRIAGYGPETTSFSRGMTLIGERLTERFGDRVDLRYVLNVLEVGYGGADLPWMVDAGVLTMAYATMSEDRIPELDLAALPFVFDNAAAARTAMDGALGAAVTRSIEMRRNVRVLGFFENGFRHVSNNVRPVRTPADLDGLAIRVLPTQLRTFELLGADARYLPLPEVPPALEAGSLDGQENPFANVVTYELHTLQRYYTATYHSYLSRAIIVHRPSYDSWPADVRAELADAVREAVALQRSLKDDEEVAAAEIIRASGGEIIELTPAERQLFIDAVAPIYDEVAERFSAEQLALIGL